MELKPGSNIGNRNIAEEIFWVLINYNNQGVNYANILVCIVCICCVLQLQRHTHTHKAAQTWSLKPIAVSSCGAPVNYSTSECGSLPWALGILKTPGKQRIWEVRGTPQVLAIGWCIGKKKKSLKASCTKTFCPIINRKIETTGTPGNFESSSKKKCWNHI